MANILYRASDEATIPVSTTVKNAPLTNLEVDGNFRSIKAELATLAPSNNPTLTGIPNAPTAALATNTTQIATTAFVGSAINAIVYPVYTVAGKSGTVMLVKGDVGLGSVDNTADSVKAVLSATKLTTARNISLSGDATGSVSFNGTNNADIVVTVADNSHNHTPANITGLDNSHNHTVANITGLQAEIDKKDFVITTTAVDKTLANRERCFVTAATKTITLPAAPVAGWEVAIGVGGFEDTVIARNGKNIMGLAENLTINKQNVMVSLTFVDNTIGWRVI